MAEGGPIEEAYLRQSPRLILTIGVIGILGYMLLQLASMAYDRAFRGL